MTSEVKNAENGCSMCGSCCCMEIPMTLLDIHRIAEFRKVDDRDVFGSAIQDGISSLTSLLMIRKDETGACVFLSKENGCTIHPAKPNICRFYSCDLDRRQEVMPWTATCRTPSQRARLWEQSMAVMVTRAYLEKNGPLWNETDYRAALGGIFENIQIRETQKLKLARDPEGNPLAMIYDCSRCEKRGAWARETPVTLDDVRRISEHLEIGLETFFDRFIAPETSRHTGGLKLKRDTHCIFFDPEEHCRIREAKPMHCRFTPCPKRTTSPEMMDALYLGSGTVDEQFRHQVAIAFTREYVRQFGIRYDRDGFSGSMNQIDRPTGPAFELTAFCKQIARYRYVDDTQLLLQG